jgi:hypothetical protein
MLPRKNWDQGAQRRIWVAGLNLVRIWRRFQLFSSTLQRFDATPTDACDSEMRSWGVQQDDCRRDNCSQDQAFFELPFWKTLGENKLWERTIFVFRCTLKQNFVAAAESRLRNLLTGHIVRKLCVSRWGTDRVNFLSMTVLTSAPIEPALNKPAHNKPAHNVRSSRWETVDHFLF